MTQTPPEISLAVANHREKWTKDRANASAARANADLQDRTSVEGERSVYTPVGDKQQLPVDVTRVRTNSWKLLDECRDTWEAFINAVSTKELGNCEPDARADVTDPDGNVVLKDVPIPFLIRLDKLLDDLRKVMEKLPTLPPGEEWEPAEAGIFKTAPVESPRMAVVRQAVVGHPATDNHPAIVEFYDAEVMLGVWSTERFFSGFPDEQMRRIMDRIDNMRNGAKDALTRANNTLVPERQVGSDLVAYIFTK